MSAEHPHLGPWALLKTPPGTCEQCAVKHEEWQAHNQQSLAYQYWFFGKHGRWPKWSDAIAHCAPEVQAQWKTLLAEKGIDA